MIINHTYCSGLLRGDKKLDELAVLLKRAKPWISRQARNIGLTNYHRKGTSEYCAKVKERTKNLWKQKKHPRGMLGKKHTVETLDKIAASSRAMAVRHKQNGVMAIKTMKMIKTKTARGTLIPPRNASWKQAWHEVGGKRFYARSSWEYEYAKILENRKRIGAIIEWEHEPETFWFEKIKRGVRSYTPDFKITHQNGDIEYHEIKGWMDARSITKIKRMAIYHKHIKLIIIDAVAYRRLIKNRI